MAGWVAKLAGDEFDLNALATVATEPDCLVTQDDGAYYLASTDFTGMQEAGDVWKMATERMLPTINGLMKVRNAGYESVWLDSVIKLNPDGSRASGGYVIGEAALVSNSRLAGEGTVTRPDGVVVPSREPAVLQSRLKLVSKDLEVRRALSFWRACDVSDVNFWFNAYKVYEVIRDDMAGVRDKGEGTKEMTKRGWASPDEIRSFKDSANNRTISGDRARHAEKQAKKPGTTALNDRAALAIIRHLLDSWLKWKTDQAGLSAP